MSVMKVLPKNCDICSVRIGLYQPFYTVETEGHCESISNFLRKGKTKELAVLCPDCFRAYKDFLTSREEYFIYKRAKSI